MTLTSARASFGLNAKATPQSANVSGTVQVGAPNGSHAYTDADVTYSVVAVIPLSTTFTIDPFSGSTTGTTSFVAGNAQVETATAAGTVSAGGNAEIILTSAGMTGSPLTIPVAVATSDTAALVAGKIRAALTANATVAARFTISGSTTAIVLTRKPTVYTSGNRSVNYFPANDTTLNLSIATGTATGITTAASSANTTSGVATTGVKVFDSGSDFEGESLPSIINMYSILMKSSHGAYYESSVGLYKGPIAKGVTLLSTDGTFTLPSDSTWDIIAETETVVFEITVCGTSV